MYIYKVRVKPHTGADILCVMQSVSSVFPSPLSNKTLREHWNSGLRCCFFSPSCLQCCVCSPGCGTKRGWGSWKHRDHKNKDRKRGLCWAWPIASERPEPVHSRQEQREFGEALALMFTSPPRTTFAHRDAALLHHQWEKYQREGLQLQAEWLGALLCPICLLSRC